MQPDLTDDGETPAKSRDLFPKGPSGPELVPFPKTLLHVVEGEWLSPGLGKYPKIVVKMYILPPDIMRKLKVPLVDPPPSCLVGILGPDPGRRGI